MSLMGVLDVARRLKVCDETVYKFCKDGSLSHSRVGRQIRISEQQLQDFLNRGQLEKPVPERIPTPARTQRITRNPEPNWDAAICQPRTRKKAV